jgi:hypothetical protein
MVITLTWYVKYYDFDPLQLQYYGTVVVKFSHQIPSYKMSGDEREGVPSGCFELDPAALPDVFEAEKDSREKI